MLAEDDGVVLIEGVAVVGGEDDFGGDGDEIAGGLAAVGVVGERRDGLREDGAAEGGVGVGVVAVEDAVSGAGVELADGGLGEEHFCVEGLGFGGEDRDGESVDVGGDVSGGACLVVAAAGEADDEREGEKEAHAAVSIVALAGFCPKKICVVECGFTGGFSKK